MTRHEQAALLRADGLTYPQIADRLSVHQQTVYRWLNPSYAQSCRRSALGWKDRNREAKRARDNTYSAREDVRGRCTTCGDPMGIGYSHDGVCTTCRAAAARDREQRFIDLYNSGLSLSRIAAEMGTTRNSLGTLSVKLRREGRIGYRYAGCRDRLAA